MLSKHEIKVLKDIRDKDTLWRHPTKDEVIVSYLIDGGYAIEEVKQMPNKYWMGINSITAKGLRALKEYKK